MSVIDDLRQLLQVLVTPEFRALSVRVDALEKKFDVRVDALKKKVDAGFIALEKKTDTGRADLKQEMAEPRPGRNAGIPPCLSLYRPEERVKRLEQDRIASHEQRTSVSPGSPVTSPETYRHDGGTRSAQSPVRPLSP